MQPCLRASPKKKTWYATAYAFYVTYVWNRTSHKLLGVHIIDYDPVYAATVNYKATYLNPYTTDCILFSKRVTTYTYTAA